MLAGDTLETELPEHLLFFPVQQRSYLCSPETLEAHLPDPKQLLSEPITQQWTRRESEHCKGGQHQVQTPACRYRWFVSACMDFIPC